MDKQITFALVMMIVTMLTAHAADNLKAFPQAAQGMTRHVLELPKQEDESLYQVELIIGKTVKTDTQNRYFFSGKIESKNIEGWGYTRYIVPDLGQMIGTLMAVDPHSASVDRFISLGGEPFLVRYNSRLPIVVYVPEAAEVHYRIWQTAPDMNEISEG